MAHELSDCKYAGKISAIGLVWCEKRKIHVNGKEGKTCEFYEKG